MTNTFFVLLLRHQRGTLTVNLDCQSNNGQQLNLKLRVYSIITMLLQGELRKLTFQKTSVLCCKYLLRNF